MNSETYIESCNRNVIENVLRNAKMFHTSKSEIAKIIGVSERTVGNRLSGNPRTPFTMTELLRLCHFWRVEIRELVSPPPPTTVRGLLNVLESEHQRTLFILRKQIEKGEAL